MSRLYMEFYRKTTTSCLLSSWLIGPDSAPAKINSAEEQHDRLHQVLVYKDGKENNDDRTDESGWSLDDGQVMPGATT